MLEGRLLPLQMGSGNISVIFAARDTQILDELCRFRGLGFGKKKGVWGYRFRALGCGV